MSPRVGCAVICVECGVKTELYFHGRPVCVNCAELQTTISNPKADASTKRSIPPLDRIVMDRKTPIPPVDVINEDSGPPLTDIEEPIKNPLGEGLDIDDALIQEPKDDAFSKPEEPPKGPERADILAGVLRMIMAGTTDGSFVSPEVRNYLAGYQKRDGLPTEDTIINVAVDAILGRGDFS